MLKIDYKIYLSNSKDPRVNLSLEEYFLSKVEENQLILFFWQSENAVVIGRNQNPYQECNISSIIEENVVMVRRLSGGGAVYHDLGNLNFAFIAKSNVYDIEKQFSIILESLSDAFGIKGESSGRNDLVIAGRKFSGNAFINEEDRHLHHGTLLIDSDVTKVSRYLSVSHKKLDNKGFDSIKSRIICLKKLSDEITVDNVIKSVENKINQISDSEVFIEIINENVSELEKYIEKYSSHDWNYGDCPEFDFGFEEKYKWGMISINLKVNEGKIENIALHTDAMDSEKFSKLIDKLKSTELTIDNVYNVIDNSSLTLQIKEDMKNLFSVQLFS